MSAKLGAPQVGPPAERAWTMADIIEVTRITSVAISADGARYAFILKQPSVAADASRYGLYVGRFAGGARKVTESAFLADLQARPGRPVWSLRGDFGQGVQVYDVDDHGRRRARVIHRPLRAGGADSLAPSASEPARLTGVLAYGWNQTGDALWYASLRPRSPAAQQAWRSQGLTYVDSQTTPTDFYAEPPAEAVELRIRNVGAREDVLVAEALGDRTSASTAFQGGKVSWRGANLIYRLDGLSPSGKPTQGLWRYDTASRSAHALPVQAAIGALASAPTAQGELRLARTDGDGHDLMEVTPGRRSNLGPVAYSALGGALGAWRTANQTLYGIRLPDRFGLASYPAPTPLQAIPDSLHPCAFDADLRIGVCSRESLTQAPELVSVSPTTGAVSVLVRPNARYDAIKPLRSEPATWTNRFGSTNSGYVTYPRDYQPGRRYPAVVITHASDAKNLFAAETFQWAFPLQVLAERGYVVLSVNESTKDLTVSDAYGAASSDVDPARMQAGMGLDAVATLEAAVADVVARGLADPARVGIAGYSRGGIVTTLALSQSKVFAAGINADTAFFSAGGFFRGGMVRELYRGLFGGSPFDAKYAPAYRAFSPSARADQFSGPLLQMFTGRTAATALELDQALREAKIPTKLIVYPGETHILHRPRTILAAMEASLDWFEQWLGGGCTPRAPRCGDRALRASAPPPPGPAG
ncbi:alpha/beta hydrolase family protein [Phenylobacterium sp.]|uniref:alpha/beta hydrolase family protein n=1 Tax=Phenylobacterium sp. TaxID=1871053 RepID=UPI003BAB7D64